MLEKLIATKKREFYMNLSSPQLIDPDMQLVAYCTLCKDKVRNSIFIILIPKKERISLIYCLRFETWLKDIDDLLHKWYLNFYEYLLMSNSYLPHQTKHTKYNVIFTINKSPTLSIIIF